MLIDADAKAGQRLLGQQRAVAGGVERHGGVVEVVGGFLRGVEGEALGTDRRGGGGYGGLVRLVDLAVRPVELDAVAVGGNVRSGHHQAGRLAGKAEQRQGRRGQRAAVARSEARPAQGRDGDGGNGRTGGAEIAADQDLVTLPGEAGGEQVAGEGGGIKCGGRPFELHGQAAQAAGSEFQAHAVTSCLFRSDPVKDAT